MLYICYALHDQKDANMTDVVVQLVQPYGVCLVLLLFFVSQFSLLKFSFYNVSC